jgi:hypothetical protein
MLPLLFIAVPPVPNKFFIPIGVEFYRLFLKPFCHSSLNFFMTCEMIAFEIFLESFEQPEVGWCQIQAVGMVWNNLKFDAVSYC